MEEPCCLAIRAQVAMSKRFCHLFDVEQSCAMAAIVGFLNVVDMALEDAHKESKDSRREDPLMHSFG